MPENPRKNNKISQILKEAEADKKRLENQRIAILNILEDVNEAQLELKKRYSELEIIKNLTQDLSGSLDLNTVLNHVSFAIEKIFPGIVIAFWVAPLEEDIFAKKINIYSAYELDKSYLLDIQKNIISGLKQDNKIAGAKNNLIEFKNTKLNFKIYRDQNHCLKSIKPIKKIAAAFNFSLVVSEKLIGLINLSRDQEFALSEQEISIIKTIIGSANQTIERLRILRQSEQSLLNSLFDSMTNGILMFDINEKILIANPVIRKIVGTENDFLLSDFLNTFGAIQKTFGANKDTKQNINIQEEIKKALEEKQTVGFEDVQIKERNFELFITPIKDYKEEVSGGALILHDITHLKEVNQMKSEFVSVASHQLRTPLTSIRLFIEMLSRGDVGPLNQDQKEYVDNVYQSTQSMIQLVNDLLNLSRIEGGQLKINLEKIYLENLITSILDEARVLAEERKCKIIFKKPKPKTKLINTDQNLLRQVIHNLITNAIRYAGTKNNKKVEIDIKKQKNNYLITVEDNGIGIPKEIQARIFEKFFRADNAIKTATEGSGLGLYVASMVIKELGGKIWFESDENKGTKFFVVVPIA